MKNIYFSKGGKFTASGMRGGWISYALSNSFTKHILTQSLSTAVKDSVVIILKHDASNQQLLHKLKSNNNILLLDVIDWLDLKKYNKDANKNQPNFFPNLLSEYYDGYIVNSTKMKEWWYREMDSDTNKPIFVIPHHWEDRFVNLPSVKYDKTPYFYYLGYIGHENQNCLHIEPLKSDGLLYEHRHGSNEAYYKDKPMDGVQLNIREYESWEYCFKPATKLVVAAAMDSLIITTNDWSVQDILDPKYPYLLEDTTYESTTRMIAYLKETHNTEVGNLARKMLKNAMEKTSLMGSVRDMYNSIIRHFSNE